MKPEVRRWVGLGLFTASCAVPLSASANPSSMDPLSNIPFGIVVVSAMFVEAGAIAFLMAFRGAAVLPLFGGYLVLNGAIFFLFFRSILLSPDPLPLPVLEALVTLADAAAIKLLMALSPFQGNDYRRTSWWYCLVVSCVANSLSYYIGVIAA